MVQSVLDERICEDCVMEKKMKGYDDIFSLGLKIRLGMARMTYMDETVRIK